MIFLLSRISSRKKQVGTDISVMENIGEADNSEARVGEPADDQASIQRLCDRLLKNGYC